MKKTKLVALATLIFGIACFVACSNEEITNESNIDSEILNKSLVEDVSIGNYLKAFSLNLSDQVVLTQTTNFISDIFLNMGVSKIIVTRNGNSIEFGVETIKTFFLNGKNIDLSEYIFVLEDDFLKIKDFDNIKLSVSGDDLYVMSSSYFGLVKDKQHFFDSLEFNILLFFIREITLNLENKIEFSQAVTTYANRQGCSFWNSYYIYSAGLSQSSSEANLKDEISNYMGAGGSLSDCRKVGGIDTTCARGNHICISTQAVCCD